MKAAMWKVCVFGNPNGDSWEISIVHSEFKHGQDSWGWFGEKKLLISHSGGPCRWPLAPGLGDQMVDLAHHYAALLNGEYIGSQANGRICALSLEAAEALLKKLGAEK